ncbi:MAG: epoxyqueuosine reductase [Deltaproteobacteria bacterium]|nr:epoxyqueuosine reductase [Deltaproteobacteria bacterium]
MVKDKKRYEDLSQFVKDLVVNAGAIDVGVVTTETLVGGPPSTDLPYVLDGAKSAVVFALALDQEKIERFLKKEDFTGHCLDNVRTNTLASGIALELTRYLEMKGHAAVPVESNFVYRKDTPRGPFDEKPTISHRYLAVRAGIGHFGLSGNVIRKKEGAAVILGSVVTEAELAPTDPLPAEDNYCDECRLCLSACASGLMHPDEKTTVTLGGVEFSYARRQSYNRCDYVCGGFSGLSKTGKWSTWSPARFPIPEKDAEFLDALRSAIKPYASRPKPGIGFYHALLPNSKGQLTCGHCQLICHPDKEVRTKRFKMLTEAGVVIQLEDGSLKAVSPEEAREHLEAMSPDVRALYEITE